MITYSHNEILLDQVKKYFHLNCYYFWILSQIRQPSTMIGRVFRLRKKILKVKHRGTDALLNFTVISYKNLL